VLAPPLRILVFSNEFAPWSTGSPTAMARPGEVSEIAAAVAIISFPGLMDDNFEKTFHPSTPKIESKTTSITSLISPLTDEF
jgi:hypothetical protein